MTLVLDNLGVDLESRLREEAEKRGVQPEDIALETLRARFSARFSDADFLIGVWGEDEFQQFEHDTQMFNRVDDPLER